MYGSEANGQGILTGSDIRTQIMKTKLFLSLLVLFCWGCEEKDREQDENCHYEATTVVEGDEGHVTVVKVCESE